MKKILIPLDFSETSLAALGIATQIARKTMHEVVLLHIVDVPHTSSFSTSGQVTGHDGMDDVFVLKCMEKAGRQLHAIIDDRKYAGVRFKQQIKAGNLRKNFHRYLNEENPDMIIMGTDGSQSLLKGFFNNSHAEEVAMHADCMVLVVKKEHREIKWKNVIFATNFEEDATEFFKKVKYLQRLFDFKLHLIYIDSMVGTKVDRNELERRKQHFVKNNEVEDYEFHIVRDITEYNGVISYAAQIKADLIALTTHQKQGMHFWGGLAEDIVNYAPVPVLTYKV